MLPASRSLKRTSRSLTVLLTLMVSSGSAASEPPAAMAPRVVRGADLLDKKRVFQDANIGNVTDIKFVASQDKAPVVVVAGTTGAAFLEPDSYRVQRVILYEETHPPFLHHDVVDVDADGKVEFAQEPFTFAAVLNSDGKVFWQHSPPGWGSSFAAFGDVDGDKKLEFLLWTLWRNQELVDWNGKSRWKQSWSGHISQVRFIDVDHDGRDELVSIDGQSLFVRDKEGKLVRRVPIENAHYVNYLEPTSYPFNEAGSRILLGYNFESGGDLKQTFQVMAADGSIVVGNIAEGDLPFYHTPCAVRLSPGAVAYRVGWEPMNYQGQLVGFSATRLQFRLYDDERRIVYDEIIAASTAEAISGDGDVEVVPPADPEQRILVGYGPEVWEYRGKKAQ